MTLILGLGGDAAERVISGGARVLLCAAPPAGGCCPPGVNAAPGQALRPGERVAVAELSDDGDAGRALGSVSVLDAVPVLTSSPDGPVDHVYLRDAAGDDAWVWVAQRAGRHTFELGQHTPVARAGGGAHLWAWLLADAAPSTLRCPMCAGRGSWPPLTRQVCRACSAHLRCSPVSVAAEPGALLWRWNPSVRPHLSSMGVPTR